VVVSLIGVVLGAAAILFVTRPSPTPAAQLTIPPTSYVGMPAAGVALGAAGAAVTIELYADFQCPACRLFVTGELPRLLTDFVRPGILRIEAHDIDILGRGPRSESLELAAGAACAAEQGAYWPFHDLIFWNQGRENRGDHDAGFIADLATAAGLDRAGFDACFARSDVRSLVERETAAARSLGIASTPTLVVNDQSLVGVPEYEGLAALIRQLAASGPGGVTAP